MRTQRKVSNSGAGTRGLAIEWKDIQSFAVKITHRFRPASMFSPGVTPAPTTTPRILMTAAP